MDLLPFGLFLINLYLEMNDKIEFSPFLTNLLFNFLEIVTFTMTTQISKKWLIIVINLSRILTTAILFIVTPKYYKSLDMILMFASIMYFFIILTNDHLVNTREILKSHFFSNLIKANYIMIKSRAIYYFIKFVIDNYSAKLYNEFLMAGSIILVLMINYNFKSLLDTFLCNSNESNTDNINRIIVKSDKKIKKNSIFLKFLINTFLNIAYCFILIVLVYSNYNKNFGNILYEFIIEKLQQPNNLIIYNSIPNNPDKRFLILVLVLTSIKENIL